jgi:hypothetical protein
MERCYKNFKSNLLLYSSSLFLFQMTQYTYGQYQVTVSFIIARI